MHMIYAHCLNYRTACSLVETFEARVDKKYCFKSWNSLQLVKVLEVTIRILVSQGGPEINFTTNLAYDKLSL